jgi:glutamyl-tRNA reductase
MDRVAVLGVSLAEAEVADLELFSRSLAGGDAVWRELADALAASELVLLGTCNRFEVHYARESGHPPGPEDACAAVSALGLAREHAARLRFRGGREAARHLFRVACSLDSLVVGEGEILAQARVAFAHAEELGLVGRLLARAFEHAFQIGKQVRAETELGRRPVSVVGVGVAELARRFRGRAPRVAVIGAGKMGELAARALVGAGLAPALVVNRSPAAAERLAASCGARALELASFCSGAEPVDALVSATSAPAAVLERAALEHLARRTPLGGTLVALDLAVPRDLEPAPGVPLEVIDLEQLRERAAANARERQGAVSEAEALVERKLEIFARRQAEERVAAALCDVRFETSAILERELEQLFRGPLGLLDPAARAELERWARTAFGRLSHVPIHAIKQLAFELDSPAGDEDAEARASGETA